MADEDQPTILFQSEDWRVTRIIRPSRQKESRAKDRLDDIHIESATKDALGKPIWKLETLLWGGRLQMTQTERQMLEVFNAMPIPRHTCEVHPSAPKHLDVTVEARPPLSARDRRMFMAEILGSIPAWMTADVNFTSGMPFDNRDGNVGISVPPAVLTQMRRLYPDCQTAVQMLVKLFVDIAVGMCP